MKKLLIGIFVCLIISCATMQKGDSIPPGLIGQWLIDSGDDSWFDPEVRSFIWDFKKNNKAYFINIINGKKRPVRYRYHVEGNKIIFKNPRDNGTEFFDINTPGVLKLQPTNTTRPERWTHIVGLMLK